VWETKCHPTTFMLGQTPNFLNSNVILYEACIILRSNGVQSSRRSPTFRRNLVHPCSGKTCNLLDGRQCLEGTCYLYLQGTLRIHHINSTILQDYTVSYPTGQYILFFVSNAHNNLQSLIQSDGRCLYYSVCKSVTTVTSEVLAETCTGRPTLSLKQSGSIN
jgi:hypothetical protein